MILSEIQVPAELPLRLNIFSLLILLGIFQGVFLSYFFLNRTNRKIQSNVFAGLFILTLSINISEVFLNYTGFILKIVWINDFSEPLNFVIGPLFFFYAKTSCQIKFTRKHLLHFIPFVLYLVYFQLYFLQPWQGKYNSFVWAYHPELEFIDYKHPFQSDPLFIRAFINEILFIHLMIYALATLKTVLTKFRKTATGFWTRTNDQLNQLRWLILIFFGIISIFVFVKVFVGRDLGDNYIAAGITFIIYMTSFNMAKRSLYFRHIQADEEDNRIKYQKSSLSPEYKNEILLKIRGLFETEKYYLNSLISLPSLSKKIGEAQHHVSQVINELCNQTFFEIIAQYRIEEARKILLLPENSELTIEELAEKVGYNSKSAFNKAFKKHTGQTPSQFRESKI
jgi:AraC-like DNA-binding protein